MCVIYFAYQKDPETPLLLCANRDEFYDRPSAPAAFWKGEPNIYAGQDLVAGGTWLGITRSGRIAAVTNYRDPLASGGSLSRGKLVLDFLRSDATPGAFIENLVPSANDYSGFNLIVGQIGDESSLFYFSNRGGEPVELGPGVYGLSNHLLDTPWPKIRNGRERFADLVKTGSATDENLFSLLADESLAAEEELPSTGIPVDRERTLSAIFIRTPAYGTRCSNVVRFNKKFEWSFEERVFA
jgi:uncharacterized protein with NRDE domain